MSLQAPFPWFGGKRRVADVVWRAFGGVVNYVEPFFGSGAMLLRRPGADFGVETVNDLDGLVANFWRAIKHAPAETAEWADNPVNENDLHARHSWLVANIGDLPSRLEGNPDWHDAKIAGWWVWRICCWIGGEFCAGKGPWGVQDGKLVHLGDAGRGINRKRVHLGSPWSAGQGVVRPNVNISDWFDVLSARLARVRVCSGDWSRVCGPTVTFKHGLTGVFLDPPYSAEAERRPTLYRSEDLDVAQAVAAWAREAGARPDMRIALCGYEGEHEMAGWTEHAWKAHGGYASQGDGSNDNARRERIWFSPACLPIDQQRDLFAPLFAEVAAE